MDRQNAGLKTRRAWRVCEPGSLSRSCGTKDYFFALVFGFVTLFFTAGFLPGVFVPAIKLILLKHQNVGNCFFKGNS